MEKKISNKIPQIKPSKISHDLRGNSRLDIRPNEGVFARVILNDLSLDVRVYDISSSGLCILVKMETLRNLQILEKVTIDLIYAKGNSFRAEYCVCWINEHDHEESKVGLRLIENWNDISSKGILPISKDYPIVGYIYKELFYLEKSVVKLMGISSKFAEFNILDSDIIFFPNQRIEVIFSLHAKTSDRLVGKIEKISYSNKSIANLIIKIENFSRSLERCIINHLILNQSLTLEDIRNSGFRVRNISSAFKFRYVKTQDEYLKVLELRLKAYSKAGKLQNSATLESVVAPLDHISRILIATHGEKVIASVALSFPATENVVLDTESALPTGYPESIPLKMEMIEVSRLCTDPEFRRGDLIHRMFEHIYKIFVESGRNYLISSTDEKLWPIYKNIGFRKVGLRYNHPFLQGLVHDLILIDLSVPTSGSAIGFFKWAFIYRKMTRHIENRTIVQRTLFGRLRYEFYNFISKILSNKGGEY